MLCKRDYGSISYGEQCTSIYVKSISNPWNHFLRDENRPTQGREGGKLSSTNKIPTTLKNFAHLTGHIINEQNINNQVFNDTKLY